MPAPGVGKALCGAQKPNRPKGETCGNVAGARTDHLGTGYCWRHGGLTPTHQAAAKREIVRQAAQTMGVPEDIDPTAALLQMLAVSYGQERWLRFEVAALDRRDLSGPVGGGEHSKPRYEPNVVIRMHQDAIDRVTRIAKLCADAGVDERRIQIEEQHGEQLARMVRAIVLGLGRSPEDPEVQRLVRGVLASGDVIKGTAVAA